MANNLNLGPEEPLRPKKETDPAWEKFNEIVGKTFAAVFAVCFFAILIALTVKLFFIIL